MQIELLETRKLVPYVRNIKNHPKSQIEKIGSFIQAFGFRISILVGEGSLLLNILAWKPSPASGFQI